MHSSGSHGVVQHESLFSFWGGRGHLRKISGRELYTAPAVARACNQEKHYAAKTLGREFRGKKSRRQPSLSVVNLPSSAPKPPTNLGPAGVNLWRSIMAEYDISDAGGQALLEQAAAAYDRAERLRVEIDRDGEIVRGRAGMREHPGLRGGAGLAVLRLQDAAKVGHQP